MTLPEAKAELEKFVKLKTTLRPAFVDVLLNADLVEVRHGRWVEEERPTCYVYRCTVCGEGFDTPYHYCPNCGASMEGIDE